MSLSRVPARQCVMRLGSASRLAWRNHAWSGSGDGQDPHAERVRPLVGGRARRGELPWHTEPGAVGSASLAVALPVLTRPRWQGCCFGKVQPVCKQHGRPAAGESSGLLCALPNFLARKYSFAACPSACLPGIRSGSNRGCAVLPAAGPCRGRSSRRRGRAVFPGIEAKLCAL